VSIIIPTKDHPELLGPCLLSLSVSMSDYAGDVEVVVVDNGTTDAIALALMTTLVDTGVIRLARYPGPFNWSALNNRAAAEVAGEVLVFLNNDIVALGVGWLSELISQALRPEVGAVGARLLFGDRSIQHAGVVVGVAGATRHEGVGTAVSDDGYLGRAKLQRRTSALTGACLATRREVFEKLGGFDEAAFKIFFNDTDYCMRVRAAGLALVYSPVATLLHFESASVSGVASPTDGTVNELAVFRDRWREALRYDPYYNAHFDRAARPFAYLAAPRRPK
jgi:GT2 family glycosyltransferase